MAEQRRISDLRNRDPEVNMFVESMTDWWGRLSACTGLSRAAHPRQQVAPESAHIFTARLKVMPGGAGFSLRRASVRLGSSGVESRMGAVRDLLAVARFPSPLIKPDVRIARIRLSDWFHLEAFGGGPMWTWRSRRTPSSPKTTASENRRVPRECTPWRLVRKSRTR